MIGTPRTRSATATWRCPARRASPACTRRTARFRAREDRGWVKVPAQEPEQRAGEREIEDRDQRLPDLRREADQADRHGGDERHARRQAVQAVDPVDAADHPDDPEDRQTAATGPEPERRATERVGDEVDRIPGGDRGGCEDDLAESQRARRSRRSSIALSAAAAAPPIRSVDTSDGDSEIGTLIAFVRSLITRNATDTNRNAAEIASPPLLGIGTTLTFAALRLIDDLVAENDPANDRGEDERQDRGGDEDDRTGTMALPAVGMKVIWPAVVVRPTRPARITRGGSLGTGNRLTISRTSSRSVAWAVATSRRRMASMMIRPTARISSGPNRRRGRRRAGCGSPTRCSVAARRMGSRSC